MKAPRPLRHFPRKPILREQIQDIRKNGKKKAKNSKRLRTRRSRLMRLIMQRLRRLRTHAVDKTGQSALTQTL